MVLEGRKEEWGGAQGCGGAHRSLSLILNTCMSFEEKSTC